VGHPLGPELGDEDLDLHLLMWDVHRNIDLEAVPPGRTVLRFSFRDVPAPGRVWWLVITRDGVDPCDTHSASRSPPPLRPTCGPSP
jgi:hypothetical protein